MADRKPCIECGTQILSTTYQKTGGRCMPCFKKFEARNKGQVFISYRREELETVASIVDALKNELPTGITIFFDIQKIESARDWSNELYLQLNRSHAILVMIGPAWSRSFGKSGGEIDVMLREIEWALDNKRALMPVLIDGVTMPSSSQLPDTISEICRKQAFSIDPGGFLQSVSALAQTIPDLITLYGDSYSVGYLRDNTREARPSSYAGKWQTILNTGPGDRIIIEYFLRDNGKFDGKYTIESQGTTHRFTGERYIQIKTIGDQSAFVGFTLDGFVDGLGRLTLSIPLDNKKGDTYIGVTKEGYSIWSKHLEKAW